MIASIDLQRAIFTALAGITGEVYDDTPTGAASPYTVIGEMIDVPDDTHDEDASEETVVLHVWDRSASSVRAKTIMAEIDAALHNTLLTLPNSAGTAFLRREFTTMLKEKDPAGPPMWRHAVMRYRARVYPN